MRTLLAWSVLCCIASGVSADPLVCSLADYKAAQGLAVSFADQALSVTWAGDRGPELRLRLAIENRAPIVRELAVRRKAGPWTMVAANVQPEFRIVSGYRRITNQQLQPLRGLKRPITSEVVDQEKWNAFWDAPL